EVKSISDRVTKTLVESTKGLASSQSGTNMISMNRAQYFHNALNNTTSYREIQNDIGIDNGDMLYNINMSLYNTDGSLYLDGTGEVVLNSGPKIPQSTNIAQTIRVVYVSQDDSIAMLYVRVW
ncbi:MAG: hypothetical protein M8353_08045, partial [ANME-2 cluster archaeon]|nr:hypothetical protein [ANME-2 cluster archaeon]